MHPTINWLALWSALVMPMLPQRPEVTPGQQWTTGQQTLQLPEVLRCPTLPGRTC